MARAAALGIGSAAEIDAIATWQAAAEPKDEISFRPTRVLLQDFTGVPVIVDLAAMREAMAALGGDAARVNPTVPAELVVDHSVQVDEFGTALAMQRNLTSTTAGTPSDTHFSGGDSARSGTSTSCRRTRGSSTR